MTETTWDKIRRALEPYKLKHIHGEEWRSNRPWSAKSDSLGLTIKVLPGGEYGMWKDHVADEGGSLYRLAEKLGIETPKRDEATETKRAYTSLEDYAAAHHAPSEAFTKAGWTFCTKDGRPALHYLVAGQDRWRFLDGNKPPFYWKSAHPAWYGRQRAMDIAKRTGRLPVIANGAASIVVAQWFGIPATGVEGGEHVIADALLDELLAGWEGDFIFAMDSDYTGQKMALGSIAAIAERGRRAMNADLVLSDRGDICDFIFLHGEQAYDELLRRAKAPEPDATPLPSVADVKQAARKLEQQTAVVTTDPAQAIAAEANKLAAQVERIQEIVAPPRVVELHELATQTLNPQYVRRWPTLPIPELAALVGPMEPELYVLLAATGMGKSWFSASLASALTRTAGTGLVVTTETSPRAFFERMVSYTARVSGLRLKDGLATPQERTAWESAAAKFKGYEGWILDMSSPTPKQVELAAKQARAKVGLSWILVDSASRMQGSDAIFERMTSVANGLQNMAREFDIPVIATSQIGRDVTDRAAGKRAPRLDDGYGSGAIEHNAGVVLGLYRHDYYVLKELEAADDAAYPPNTARLTLLKHRNRPVPDIPYCTVKYEAGCGLYQYRTVSADALESGAA